MKRIHAPVSGGPAQAGIGLSFAAGGRLLALALTGVMLALAPAAQAERMPQDNWYYAGSFGGQGTGAGQFQYIGAWDTSPKGYTAVADGYRIQIFDENDQLVRTLGDGVASAEAGKFYGIRDISFDGAGRLFVLEVYTHVAGVYVPARVQVFNADFNFSHAFSTNVPNGANPFRQFLALSDGSLLVFADNSSGFAGFRRMSDRGEILAEAPNLSAYGYQPAEMPNGEILVWGSSPSTGWLTKVMSRELILLRDYPVTMGSYSWSGYRAFSYDGRFLTGVNSPAAMQVYGFDSAEIVTAFPSVASANPMFTASGDILYVAAGDSYRIHRYRRAFNTVGPREQNRIPQARLEKIEQRPGTPLLDIDYTVSDPDDVTVDVALFALRDGVSDLSNMLPARSLVEGTAANLGPGTTTGAVHRVTWNAGLDWPVDRGNLVVNLLVKDKRPKLIDLHFLHLPADGALEAMVITRTPLKQGDFLPMWFWIVAKNDSRIAFNTNGQITGTDGTYNGTILAQNTLTTDAGRAFLFELLGVREATAAEVQRAKEGATPGVVNQWDPTVSVGPGLRPLKVNEYGFDTGTYSEPVWWAIKLN